MDCIVRFSITFADAKFLVHLTCFHNKMFLSNGHAAEVTYAGYCTHQPTYDIVVRCQ